MKRNSSSFDPAKLRKEDQDWAFLRLCLFTQNPVNVEYCRNYVLFYTVTQYPAISDMTSAPVSVVMGLTSVLLAAYSIRLQHNS